MTRPKIVITDEFTHALDLIEQGKNVLITGKAGTGKSTLLRLFLGSQSDKNILITAPTGVAALNIGGFTIHKAFGFFPGIFPDDVDNGKWHTSKETWAVLSAADILVIDEISMVRADLFDTMDRALRKVRRTHLPFGGIQLIAVGDLLQLPPVVTAEEASLFHQHWSSPYFFSAHCYPEVKLSEINLTTLWRQSDDTFINILNEVREGTLGDESMRILNSCVDPTFIPPNDWVTLTARNNTAAKLNHEKLTSLGQPIFTSSAIMTGNATAADFNGSTELHYAVGARVMTTINDPSGRFVNGSFATVVTAGKDSVGLVIDDSGEHVTVARHLWEVRRPKLEGAVLGSEVTGTISQIPIILAWAITIHKSQGKTIPKCFINLTGGTRTDGQFYVALSRAVSLKNLRFNEPVQQHHIRANNALVRKVRREVITHSGVSRFTFISITGVSFGVSEHVARIHALIYEGTQMVASFGTWINPMADLGSFGAAHGIPSGGLAMAPTLGDFWPLLLRQARGSIVVGDGLAMLERAVQHQEKGLVLGLGVGYDASDFDLVFSTEDVVQRCQEMAEAFLAAKLPATRGLPVPSSSVDAEGAVFLPSWAPPAPMMLDMLRATDSDIAWAAMSGASAFPRSSAEVEECGELLSSWAISRGHWPQESHSDIQSRATRILGRAIPLPAPLQEVGEVADLLIPGSRVAFTGCRDVLGGGGNDEWLEEVCERRALEYKKRLSRTKCDLLVAADVASTSRKAQAARDWGKPIISLSAFEHWYENGPFRTEASTPSEQLAPTHVKGERLRPTGNAHSRQAPFSTAALLRSPVEDLDDDEAFIPTDSEVDSEVDALLQDGCRVVFKGSITIYGERYYHGPMLQELCSRLGLEYKQAVSKSRCDVLIADDPNASDGKTALAREYHKPIFTRAQFVAWAQRELADQDDSSPLVQAPRQACAGRVVDSWPLTDAEKRRIEGRLLSSPASAAAPILPPAPAPLPAQAPLPTQLPQSLPVPSGAQTSSNKPTIPNQPKRKSLEQLKFSVWIILILTAAIISAAALKAPDALGAILIILWLCDLIAVIIFSILSLHDRLQD